MFYNPATPTVQEILTAASGLLMDIDGAASNAADLRKWFRMSWDMMVVELKRHSLNDMAKSVTLDVEAGSISIGPSWSTAFSKFSILDDIGRFNPPLFEVQLGFPQELKQATQPLDLQPGRFGYYNYFSGIFYINPPLDTTKYLINYTSNLTCPTDGPIGIEHVAPYLSLMTAYWSGNADGNVGANLKEYESKAKMLINGIIDLLVAGEGPIETNAMDLNYQNGGTRRYPTFGA